MNFINQQDMELFRDTILEIIEIIKNSKIANITENLDKLSSNNMYKVQLINRGNNVIKVLTAIRKFMALH
ncbi:hypothetical protein BEN51_07390 [Clostridium isatidis]|uniref:Uncharacterized protein n=2 Tax=Clostridium isatidis TaxID=182773 RepID=A0A343JCQ0_9CLOT|nr:hypothetical protein BEN51_07390 [Clostridium isatidis]